jgi:hypothetical protein
MPRYEQRWKTLHIKQMGDAGKMFIAAEMTLAGVPALKMPDNWPCYDVVAQRTGGRAAQRMSVKSRTSNVAAVRLSPTKSAISSTGLPSSCFPEYRIQHIIRGHWN